MTRRDAIILLPATAAAVLAAGKKGKKAKPRNYIRAYWKGKLYKIFYRKIFQNIEFLVILMPDGRIVEAGGPDAPFNIVHGTDGEYNLVPPGNSGKSAPRKAGEQNLFYLLDVASQDRIIMFNMETGGYVNHIDVDLFPQGFALSPDGSLVYVSYLRVDPGIFPAAPPHIAVYNTTTRTLATKINLANDKVPRKPVFSPDGSKLYIPHDGTFVSPTGTTGASVLIVDPATNTYTGEMPTGATGGLDKLVITSDGSMIYAAAIQSFPARIYAFDTASGTVSAPVSAPSSIKDMLLDFTGTRLYLLSESSIVAFDTATLTQVGRVDFTPNPRFNVLSLSFDGSTLFANHEFAEAITPIDAETLIAQPAIGNTAQTLDGSFAMMLPLGPEIA